MLNVGKTFTYISTPLIRLDLSDLTLYRIMQQSAGGAFVSVTKTPFHWTLPSYMRNNSGIKLQVRYPIESHGRLLGHEPEQELR